MCIMKTCTYSLVVFLTMIVFPLHTLGDEDTNIFLDDLQKRGIRFFLEEAHPESGLIYDRARFDGSEHPHDRAASMAGMGFALTALCIGQERGWIDPDTAYDRVLNTMRFIWEMEQVRGFYYHFVDIETGERIWDSELSTIDTALLVAGALTAGEYYKGTEVETLARKIYERVEWPWMLTDRGVFTMGWTPEEGFIRYYWGYYSEHKMLYLLAMSSPTHPVSPEVWHNWRRLPVITYGERTFLACPPLFTHQYSQSWFDFRNQRDAYADYHLNTILATRAQRQMFMDLSHVFPKFGEDLWGLTASDSPDGYVAWGGPPMTLDVPIDGTVTPYAAGGAISFTPDEALHTLQHMRNEYGDMILDRYGFSIAFNPHTGWVHPDIIGIDMGVTVISAENYRSGFVWDTFMRNPEAQKAMRLAGFRDIAPDLSESDRDYLEALAQDTWSSIQNLVHPDSGLPYVDETHPEETSLGDIGLYLTAIVAAYELDLINRDTASQRVGRALNSIRQFDTWKGFPPAWNVLDDGTPSPDNPSVSTTEAGLLAAGLITVGQALPETEETIRPLVENMEWDQFYDENRNALLGEFDRAHGQLNEDWILSPLASDSRIAVFLAVATGQAPSTLWDGLERNLKNRYHTEYFAPGWQGGGLFMAYMSGLWLDEAGTPALQSARNFTYAQMQHGEQLGFPVWGWSACIAPDGEVLGWDTLRDEIITPHASILALDQYPREVVANLRSLERLNLRDPNHGFYDSVDVGTRQIAETFLNRHQCMILITLANHLRNNVIRNYFQADPIVREGRYRIRDFHKPPFAHERSLFSLHPSPPDIRVRTPKQAVAFPYDGWEQVEWTHMTADNAYDSGNRTEGNEVEARFAFAWDEDHLHFTARLTTSAVANEYPDDEIAKGNCVELFLNPQNDGLRWKGTDDFQFGFAVEDRVWEWFNEAHEDVGAVVRSSDHGYTVEARIPWTTLRIEPEAGAVLQVSPAIHSVDEDTMAGLKLNWDWEPAGPGVRLGQLELVE